MILHTILSNGDSFWAEVKTVNFDEDGCAYTLVGEEEGYMVYSVYGKPRKECHVVSAYIHDEKSMLLLEARDWPMRDENRVDRPQPNR